MQAVHRLCSDAGGVNGQRDLGGGAQLAHERRWGESIGERSTTSLIRTVHVQSANMLAFDAALTDADRWAGPKGIGYIPEQEEA